MRTIIKNIIKTLEENPNKTLVADVDGKLYPITDLDLDIVVEHHTFDFNTECLLEGEVSNPPLIKNTNFVAELNEVLALDIKEIYPHIFIDDKHLVGEEIIVAEDSVILTEDLND